MRHRLLATLVLVAVLVAASATVYAARWRCDCPESLTWWEWWVIYECYEPPPPSCSET